MNRQRWTVRALASAAVVAVLAGIASCRGTDVIVEPLGRHEAESVERIEVLVPPEPYLEVGSELQLEAIAYCKHDLPIEGAELTWSTTTPETASVAEGTGLVTALRSGTAGIRVESGGVRESMLLQIEPYGRILTPEGGEISYPDGRVVLVVPEGALAEPTRITIEKAEPSFGVAPGRSMVLPDLTYRLGPEGTQLLAPVLITLRYGADDLPSGADARRLRVHRLVGDDWALLESSSVDVGARRVWGRTSSFSLFAVLDYRPAVGAVAVTPAETVLEVGATERLSATILDPSGEPVVAPDIVWSSSNPTVAAVDATGEVEASMPGWATIRAESDGEVGEAAVAVFTSLESITVEPSVLWLVADEVATLRTRLFAPGGGAVDQVVAWSSDDATVAVASPAGVRAVGVGETTIRAASGGRTAEVPVHVTTVPSALVISPSGGYYVVGDTVRFEATVVDAAGVDLGRPVSWTANAPGELVGDGTVTASVPGAVILTATSGEQASSIVVFFVAADDIAASVEIEPSPVTVEVGDTLALTATVRDRLGSVVPAAAVTWSSADPSVATVDQNGIVKGISAGATLLVAQSGRAVGVGEAVVVSPRPKGPPNTVDIWPKSLALTPGGSAGMSATVYDATGTAVESPTVDWTSSDPTVVSVEPTGLVTGVGAGTATVTATSGGSSGTVTVLVDPYAGGGAGGEEGAGNNLSWPVVFTEGYGLTGLPVGTDTGLRPTAAEGITVTSLPFFAPTNVPDYSAGGTDFYLQKGDNVWQAEWLDGSARVQSAQVTWGDNLTHHTFSTHTMIRVEVSLSALDVGPLAGYAMTSLYGQGSDEMQGTDGTVAAYEPSLYTVAGRLKIEKLDGTTFEPVHVAFDGSVADGLVTEGPGSFGVEVNVAGRIIYGYNLRIRDLPLPSSIEKFGWWRLTFSLDDPVVIGGQAVARGLSLDRCGNEPDDEELTYTPSLDPVGQSTVLDIWIASASGGGSHGGSGGSSGHTSDEECGGH